MFVKPLTQLTNRRRFLTISATLGAGLLATGLNSATANLRQNSWQGVVMAADASIQLRGEGDLTPVLQDLTKRLGELEAMFSLYQPDSLINRLNRQRSLTIDEITPEFAALVELCDQLYQVTEGYFDPTIQNLWRKLASKGATLKSDERNQAQSQIGWSHFTRQNNEYRLAGQTEISFNGVAQGFITDDITTLLHQHGFLDVLVNIGEFRASGGSWPLAIASPDGEIEAKLQLKDGQALATSHRYASYFTAASANQDESSPKIIGHILSPKEDNDPKRQTIARNASVLAQKAVVADGLSTALTLMSDEKIQLLQQHDWVKQHQARFIMGPYKPLVVM